MTLREQRMSYWGHRFEHYMTESPDQADAVVDTNVEFCVVFKTKLGQHRLLMAAEMDCVAQNSDAKRRNTAMPDYIELKTARKPNNRSRNAFFQYLVCLMVGSC